MSVFDFGDVRNYMRNERLGFLLTVSRGSKNNCFDLFWTERE